MLYVCESVLFIVCFVCVSCMLFIVYFVCWWECVLFVSKSVFCILVRLFFLCC